MKRCLLGGLAGLMMAMSAPALTIEVDFSYDGGYFEGNPAAKATVLKAAQDLSAALADTAALGAISTGQFTGTNGSSTATFEWQYSFRNPQNFEQTITLPTFSVAADVFRIYTGAAASLAGDELGAGAPLGVAPSLSVEGTEAQIPGAITKARQLSNASLSRGRGPAFHVIDDAITIGATQVDYTLRVGAVAGSFTFDTSEAWNFDANALPGPTQYDFYTVVLHEMIHSLGFGNAQTWTEKRSGGNWLGDRVIALEGSGVDLVSQFYDPGTPQEKPDGGHITPGTMSTTLEGEVLQEAVMTPTLGAGERRKLTHLDIAFLLDIGYDPALPPFPGDPDPVATPSPTPAPTVTSEVPAAAPKAPIIAGKAKQVTTKSKVTLAGTLLSPGAYVQYQIGRGKFVRAKGGAAWKITVKLKPGKNVITIVSYDPATGQTSPPRKIVVTRR